MPELRTDGPEDLRPQRCGRVGLPHGETTWPAAFSSTLVPNTIFPKCPGPEYAGQTAEAFRLTTAQTGVLAPWAPAAEDPAWG